MSVIFHKGTMYGGGSGGSGASAISDLTDVELTNLADGQILKYDATNQVWVNDDESGGGGGSYSETLLYANAGTSVGNISLSDAYTNYDQLYFECIRTADSRSYVVPYYMTANSLDTTGHFQLFGYNEYCSYDVTNSTTFTKVNNSGNWYIKNIYGIKY